jgi:polysaccharide biosynthesis protein PslH
MQILLVLNSPPLPFGTADARWYYVLLKELVSRGHQVTAFAVCAKAEDADKARALFPAPAYDLRCYAIEPPGSGLGKKLRTIREPYAYIFSEKLRRDLTAELAQPYDIIHLEQLWSGWLGLPYPDRVLVNIHYLHSLDRSFEQDNSLETTFRRLMTDRAERKLMRAFPHITALSDRLSQQVRQVNPQAQVRTVPLGIDLSLYPFNPVKQRGQQPVVGLIGGFNWGPSYSAAERLITRLWPEIKRQVPDAKLQIVGRDAQRALAKFGDIQGLEIFQDVPDTLPYFANTDVMLYAPVAGSGMKVKVMEAFALGTPVITTAEGVEGLPARDGVHAGICEDDRGLIDRTVALLADPGLADRLRSNARALLEEHCSPPITVAQIEQIYSQIVNR